MIVNEINETWSPDLPYVDKLAKYNRGLRHLLVAINCLSCYLRVEPLKTKYALRTAKALKNDRKNNQKKFGLTKAQSSKKNSEKFVLNKKSSNTTLTLIKNQRLPNGTFDRSKVLSTSTWSLNGHTVILKNYRVLFRRSKCE